MRDTVAYFSLLDRIEEPVFPLLGLAEEAKPAKPVMADEPLITMGDSAIPTLETNASREWCAIFVGRVVVRSSKVFWII